MEILAWVLSFTSAIMLWMMGNKNKYAPLVGIGNQVLWIVYTVVTKQYGLIPGVLIYLIVHIRNYIKWNRK
jgi:hypothetical protein